jgi:hypothetical protein
MVVAVFLTVFLIFTGVGWLIWSSGHASAALMNEGAVTTLAQVDSLYKSRSNSTTSTSNSSRYNHYARVSYADAAGQPYQAHVSISKHSYNAWQIGQQISLRYAVADPSVVELRPGDLADEAQFGYWFMVGGLVGAGLTVIAAVIAPRLLRRRIAGVV